VDRALTEERSVLITWLNRGTLHLVGREDYAWLHALTTPQLLAGNARRLAQEGVDADAAERGVRVIERSLSSEGMLSREELAASLQAAAVPTAGQALVHLLMLASLRGLIVRGPMIGAKHGYALVRDWLGEQPTVDREQALAEMARRYLVGHGPADERDLAKWAGLPLRDSRAGLAAIGPQLTRQSGGLVDVRRRGAARRLPPPRLLGAFDPVLHGWTSRQAVLGSHEGKVVSGGMFRPFALVHGRGVATWRLERGAVALEPFARLQSADTTALLADGEDVLRFLER
jgi:hypothetical protein